ncbi:2-keto-3-deoxy-D-arabino-heptulosonate-7-phosphate synthase I alpha [hydrothermal vent metagenome]|uniref:3-deoxy-7-phosphoheptulonate synthase n=1 Tax=hydrothermal vent metagenome TaxID=652676 RepID=A0A3B0Y4C8_9ZZZZ
MTDEKLNNLNVLSQELLPTPEQIKKQLPVTDEARTIVVEGRKIIRDILAGSDKRLFVVVGPCSIHDPKAAHEYAERLKILADEVSDTLVLIMRVYFEKPRTTVGWKGLINDPDMDDSFHIEKGLSLARRVLLDIANTGLFAATEALDPITPQYLSDLITWTAIGARTTESQTHREMSSGLSTPVGFKNGTDGSLQVAINALHSVSQPHHFLGINQSGECAVFRTKGNSHGHVVLRGGGGRSNYDSVNIKLCEDQLAKANLPANIVVDCSHGNSMKDHNLQSLVLENCTNQILEGNQSIIGVMLESNIEAGNQAVPKDLTQLKYGVSVTDACVDWATTEKIIREMQTKLQPVLASR